MKNKVIIALLSSIFLLGAVTDVNAQRSKKKSKKNQPVVAPKPKPKPKKGAIQPYGKVITKNAKTDDGLFKVHDIEGKLFYEIPDSLFNKEMLMVTRIAKTYSGNGFGGGKANTQVLRWEKKAKKVLLRVVSHNVVADNDLPVKEAVVNSNLEPILFAFDIKAFNKDSTATVIEVNKLFDTDVPALGLPQYMRTQHKVSVQDKSRSYIESLFNSCVSIAGTGPPVAGQTTATRILALLQL